MAKPKTIKLANLIVNTENYRFEPTVGQKEAIDEMISDQKEKLFNLVEHIIENGLNPNDRIQVMASNHDPRKYNVLEGNRRTIALKLLDNPDLIDDHKFKNLKKRFSKLREANKENLFRNIECTVYDDLDEAKKWIGIKHGYGKPGTSTDGWDPLQKGRFEEDVTGNSPITLQVIKLLEKSQFTENKIKTELKNIPMSSLERLINDPDVRNFHGIEKVNNVLQSDVEEKEVVKGLSRMAEDLLNPDFKVKKIYTKIDRQDYLKGFPKASRPDTSSVSSASWQLDTPSSSITGTPKPAKTRPLPKDRSRLIPANPAIQISNPKVNKIYHELRQLDVNKYTNAVAVLFRVFVELSVDTYLEENNLVSTPSAARSNKNLYQKVSMVAQHLQQKGASDASISKGIRVVTKDENSILGIDTWHAYVHNNKFSPTPSNLVLAWDGMAKFMSILWDHIK